MTAQETAKWPGLKYQPVTGIINRVLARYLRATRRDMRRFFAERGLLELADRVNRIRLSPRSTMLQKNAAFQKVLDDYAKLVSGTSETTAPKATHSAEEGVVGVSGEGGPESGETGGIQRDSLESGRADRSVQQLATEDGGV